MCVHVYAYIAESFLYIENLFMPRKDGTYCKKRSLIAFLLTYIKKFSLDLNKERRKS